MRRPALYRPALAGPTAWAHPYTGVSALSMFYNDGGTPPAPAPAPTPAQLAAQLQQQPPAPVVPNPASGDDEEKVTFTQRRLNVLMKGEKEEGRRAAFRTVAEAAGLDPDTFDPAKFADMFKQAEEARQAQMSEEQRRAEELAQKERDLEARVAAAEAKVAEAAKRDRESRIRAALVRLGATGDDLDDAVALMRVADDADDAAITAAADALKGRRGELFGATPPSTLPPAPSGAPAGGPPARTPAGGKDAINTAARQRAIDMGLRNDDAA